MAFNEKLPKWDNVGVEPPESKKTEGWQPTEKPPAQWFNWIFNRIYKVVEELQGKSVEKGIVGSLVDLTTTIKTSIVNAINSLLAALESHKAENANKAHGGFKGALYRAIANQSIPNSVWTKLVFGNVVYDSSTLFDVANNRFIVPTGVTKVKISALVYISSTTTRTQTDFTISKNGTRGWATRPYIDDKSGQKGYYVTTPVVSVVSGDYFEVELFQISGVAIDIEGNIQSRTMFSIEVIE